MTKIIQITDTHIVPEGKLAYDKVDTAAALEETVATVNRVLPQIGPVNLAVVTGDLTDFGTAGEYTRFKAIMERLAIPYRVVPGNHDNREAMRAAFCEHDWMPPDGPVDWIADLADFALVGLDSNVPQAPHGHLSEASLDFLRHHLNRLAPKPFLVGIHHPPVETGIVAMDEQNLRSNGALSNTLSAHPGEVRLICGHVHRNVVVQFGKVICQIAPGTSHAVTLEQRRDAGNSLTIEPGGFMLHEWRDGLVSHSIPVGAFEGPYPFYQ
jgi:3',5'-cyclic AMP phosphodiesterase CpdA